MDLQVIAKFIGFGSFSGMIMYFVWLGFVALSGYVIYIGQKGGNKK